jgi:two-component system OmpR family response regulator
MNKHILIVDDEADIRDLLTEFLGQNGYRVSPVPTAIEAERIVDKDPPQLIISDLQLEDSDGLDMIARVKAKRPEIQVILLTGVYIDPRVVRETLGEKVGAYIQKTSPLTKILEEVRGLIGS